MAIFEYKGLDKSGKSVKGQWEAESLKAAKNQLKTQNIFLQEIKNKQTEPLKGYNFITQKKVKTKDATVFIRLLATLLKANVPLVEALDAICRQTPDKYFTSIISDIKDQVNEGKAFYLSLKKYPNIFDLTFISLCQAGEASGNLDEILLRLAILKENQEKTKRKVGAAMIYPGILFVSSMAIMIFLFTNVVPQITDLLEDKSQIPWITRVTISFSDFLVSYWLSLLIFVILGFLFFLKWKKTKRGKLVWDFFTLKIPVIGRLLRVSDISLFAKTFSTLMSGGVPVLQALDIVKDVVRNDHIKLALQAARKNIKEGESIALPLSRSHQFPPVVIQMIQVGEKSGQLEALLNQVGDSYDRQVETEIEALTSILNPVMIIFMACMVAFIVFSILLPMMGSFEGIETL